MKTKTASRLSILLNIVLILFFIIYFCVPWSSNGFWAKAFSPLCTFSRTFQSADHVPGWCGVNVKPAENAENSNNNDNINNNNTNSTSIANPASVKCAADGGQSEIYTKADGSQDGLCIFSDQSICEEWAYFRGECQKGQCQKVCKAINTNSEGWYNSCTGELISAEKCSTETNSNANANTNTNANVNANANVNVNAPVTNSNTNASLSTPAPSSSALITVDSPTSGQQLTSPIVISGRAKVPDNKIYVRVKSKSGSVAISVNGTMKNVGADGYGDFKLTIKYEFSTTKEGSIDVYGMDGSTEVGLVNIPVKY